MVSRWSHKPKICVGIPIVPGAPKEAVQEVLKDRLRAEYVKCQELWPEQDSSAGGKN
jgi:hypothetical protein